MPENRITLTNVQAALISLAARQREQKLAELAEQRRQIEGAVNKTVDLILGEHNLKLTPDMRVTVDNDPESGDPISLVCVTPDPPKAKEDAKIIPFPAEAVTSDEHETAEV